ncbi:MAG: DUF4249 domain-containing protein [Ignavibacteriales bacterium]|nr:DUF4249 domain-containing protein [Ignavibacteriales bacterium]MCB9258990.1 DUF4249 domain-containing protein [Ignavibacteriales bacterium]
MKKIYVILFVVSFFLGCEEIIEVDLNSADPQIVIEAKVSPRHPITAKISTSTDFYNPGSNNPISGAKVNLFANNLTYELEEVNPGEYINKNLTALPETQYTIEVNYNNQNYTASSFMPKTILIDSLSYKLEDSPFNKNRKFLELHVHFKDDPDRNEYARFLVYRNEKQVNNISLYDDRLTNGNEIDFFFFNFNDEEFQRGDTIDVVLMTVDEPVFTYLKTMRRALANSSRGPFGPQAPANPISNWSNGAFGYFSAYTWDFDSIILE